MTYACGTSTARKRATSFFVQNILIVLRKDLVTPITMSREILRLRYLRRDRLVGSTDLLRSQLFKVLVYKAVILERLVIVPFCCFWLAFNILVGQVVVIILFFKIEIVSNSLSYYILEGSSELLPLAHEVMHLWRFHGDLQLNVGR